MAAKQVIYSGRVQGVGFRFTTRQIATGFDVTGWVKNLPDGTVELQAQAMEAQELDDFLEAILESNLGSLIQEHQSKVIPPLSGLKGFSIVR